MTAQDLIKELSELEDKDIDVCFEETNGTIVVVEDLYILVRRDGEQQIVLS